MRAASRLWPSSGKPNRGLKGFQGQARSTALACLLVRIKFRKDCRKLAVQAGIVGLAHIAGDEVIWQAASENTLKAYAKDWSLRPLVPDARR